MPLWPALHQRSVTPEVMDQPGLDPADHTAALRGLARANAWSGSAGILWPALRDLARTIGRDELRILDVATGAGDVPLRLWQKARAAGLRLTIEGCDLSPVALQTAAERAARTGADLHFFPCDVLRDPLPERGYDAVICSLFLHHLDDGDAVELLRRMAAAARRLVLVNDLARSRLGYMFAYAFPRLMSRSRVMRIDGPLSVQAAFTPDEALRLAHRAGLRGATVARRWPCRYLLRWDRPEGA